jgi:hypothetical protein
MSFLCELGHMIGAKIISMGLMLRKQLAPTSESATIKLFHLVIYTTTL